MTVVIPLPFALCRQNRFALLAILAHLNFKNWQVNLRYYLSSWCPHFIKCYHYHSLFHLTVENKVPWNIFVVAASYSTGLPILFECLCMTFCHCSMKAVMQLKGTSNRLSLYRSSLKRMTAIQLWQPEKIALLTCYGQICWRYSSLTTKGVNVVLQLRISCKFPETQTHVVNWRQCRFVVFVCSFNLCN